MSDDYRKLSREDLDSIAGEQLPERAAMSLINANLAIPVNAAVAANVLSDGATAYANAVQQTPIDKATTEAPHERLQAAEPRRAQRDRRRGAPRARRDVPHQRQRGRARQRRRRAERALGRFDRVRERAADRPDHAGQRVAAPDWPATPRVLSRVGPTDEGR